MHPVIADKKEDIVIICQRYDVAKLEIYGSAARGKDFDPDKSDADFLVEFFPSSEQGLFDRFMGLFYDLRNVLGRKVDLGEMGAITNPYLKASIDEDREIVFEA